MSAKSVYDVETTEEQVAPENTEKPKKRHRRTKAELMQDPEYCQKHGLPMPDGAPVEEEPKKAPRVRRTKRQEPDYGEPDPCPQEEVAMDEAEPVEKETIEVKPAPASSFKRIYKSRWAFDVWDSKEEVCLRTQQLPSWVTEEYEAIEETKKYVNDNIRALNGCNIVVYEIHKEFRLQVTAVTIQE